MAGAAQLLRAVDEHDRQVDDYRERSQRVFAAVDPYSHSNIEGYAQRLLHLVGGNPDFRASEVNSRRGAFA